jgi:secondary thiamine-phosphate synthase enzyme
VPAHFPTSRPDRPGPARPGASWLHNAATVLRVWAQGKIELDPLPRGFHLITREILAAVPRIAEVEVGLLHLFICHTSASLTINENASADVRRDFEAYFDETVAEGAQYWTHTLEGADDMPAHIKSSLLGPSLTIPVAHGRLALGTWQGIYVCEHRDHGGSRSLVATLQGETHLPGA